MATFTETIQMNDEVTPAARAAQSALKDVGRSLEATNKQLVIAEGLGDTASYDKAIAGIKTLTDLQEKLAVKAAPAIAADAASADAKKNAMLAASEAQRIANAQAAADKQSALDKRVADKKIADDAAMWSKIDAEEAKHMAKMSMFAEEQKQISQAAAAKQTALEAKAAEDRKQQVVQQENDKWAKIHHVMQVGKETIQSALTNIGAAFSALAQGDAKGAVLGLVAAVADMAKLLDLVVPGLGQAVSAVIKIAGGLVGITVGLIQSGMEFAIAASQGKQQMLSMFDAMGDGIATGAELDDMLSELADTIGISKDKLAEYTKAFLQMGVTGVDELEALTLAAESANAIVGKGGAEAFTNLQKKIQLAAETGGQIKLDNKFLKMVNASGAKISDLSDAFPELKGNIKDATVSADKLGKVLTDAIIKRGEAPLAKLANSIGELKDKFMQDIGDIFEDIDVAPFMAEVKELFGIFGQANPSGQALKAGIGAFFTETFAIAKLLVPVVKHFMLDLIIYGLQAYIALKPTIEALKTWLATAEGIQAMGVVWTVLKGALIAVAVVLGLIVGAITLVVGLFALLITSVWSVVGALGSLVYDVGAALLTWIASAATMGYDFVAGLVAGISSGYTMVTDAVKGLADGAVNSFKSALGIASPSKVMMEMGAFTGEGFNIGLGEAANDTYGAAGQMASAAVDTAQGSNAGQGGASGGGSAGNVFYITIQGGSASAQEIAEEVVAKVNERMAMAAGG